VAKFKGYIPVATLGRLRGGVVLDDGHRTAPAELFVTREERGNTWLQITITEGKNRQIHRMGEAVGHRVMRLARVAFAGLTTEGLPPGRYREVSGDELRKLKRDYKNPSKRHKANAARERLADARYGVAPEAEAEPPAKPPAKRSPGRPRKSPTRKPRAPATKPVRKRRNG
jgi:hypothetical protein